MGRIVSLALFLFLAGCQMRVAQEDLTLLNGYWEIEKVVLANGQTKNYKVNTTLDYIELKELSGYRKKVYPNLNGTFDTSNDSERFTVVEKNNAFEFHYKNNLSEWTEKIVFISDTSFSITNEEGITYHYKRFEPIKVQ